MWTNYNVIDSHFNIFDDLFGHAGSRPSQLEYRFVEDERELVFSFDLPGVKPEDIDLNVDDKKLCLSYTLRGKKYSRKYTINADVDTSATKAKLEHGVLELHMPFNKKTKAKKIEIEVN